MLPACHRGTGANVHKPDVCLTPPAPSPVPYVNVALNVTAIAFVPHVFVAGINGHNQVTMLATSFGDEAGVAHWTIKGWSKYVVGNPIVNVGMLPGQQQTCATMGNCGNAKGAALVPSKVNVFYTDARTLAPATPSIDDVAPALPLVGRDADASVAIDDEDGVRTVAVRIVAPAAPLLVRRALAGWTGRVVLDLRGNPGGDLDAAVRLAELFLPAGSVVARVEDALGHVVARRTRLAPAFEGPLEVRVDRGTASAAEVLAAALADHGRASIVGGPTWGKGSVATLVGGALAHAGTVRSPLGRPMGAIARGDGDRRPADEEDVR